MANNQTRKERISQEHNLSKLIGYYNCMTVFPKECGACKTFCGRLVKITRVSASFPALHSSYVVRIVT